MGNQETQLQGPLLNFHQENALINAQEPQMVHSQCERISFTKIRMLLLCNVLNVIKVGLDRFRARYTREQDRRTVKGACAN